MNNDIHFDYESMFYDDNINHKEKELLVGEEMYNPMRFWRDFHIWRIPHLTTRFVPINNKKFQLPGDSVLHVLDNIHHGDNTQDAPRLEENSLIRNESYRKWIYHVRTPEFQNDEFYTSPVNIDWSSGEPIKEPTIKKFIFRPAGLINNLMKFRAEQKNNFRYLHTLEDIPRKREALTIINHNPIFRIRVYGRLQFFRRMQLIWASICNIACKIPDIKRQYIYLPLTPVVYPKEMFYRSRDRLTITTIKRPEDYHYIFMMNFLNFINVEATTSIFSQIPQDVQKRLTFILVNGDKAIFHTLSNIKEINNDNKVFIRIVNNLNLLALSSTPTDTSVVIDNTDEAKNYVDTDDDTSPIDNNNDNVKQSSVSTSTIDKKEVSEDKSTTSTVKEKPKIDIDKELLEDTNIDELTNYKVDVLNADAILNKAIKNVKSKSPNSLNEKKVEILKETQEEKELVDSKFLNDQDKEAKIIEQKINELNKLNISNSIKHQTPINRIKVDHITEIIEENVTDKFNTILNEKVITTNISTSIDKDISMNITAVKPSNVSNELSKERAINQIKDLDEESFKFIDTNEKLTPSQKSRYKTLATQYKKLNINGKNLLSVLEEPTSVDVKSQSFDFLDDQIVDKSMLRSSINNLDFEYIKTTADRDFASVVTSFNKNGVFLTDLTEEYKIDELNWLKEYTVSYEDILGRKSSSKIVVPIVDKHGHCYINGSKKIFKKQLVNLPIVKLSPTRISLASNYNKTIVERNDSKAHNFLSYFTSLLNKSKGISDIDIYIEFGRHIHNLPLAYEYTELSTKFKYIKINNKQDVLYLIFGNKDNLYKNDKLILNTTIDKKSIDNLESKLSAIFTGFTSKYLLFIDINNYIYKIDINKKDIIDNSSIDTTNYIHLVQELVNIKMSSSLTEYVDLKVLNGKLPIIFVLAYKYGLKATLEYLKVDYQLIDKKITKDSNEDLNLNIQKFTKSNTDISIKFYDKTLIINRYPLTHSLIVSGLSMFDTEEITFEEMELKSSYYTLLEMKNIKVNLLKGIDNLFDLFIDDITKDVLQQMNEPTNFRDLLIRSVVLLSTTDHKEAASAANHRFRTYERINGIIYNEMSQALAKYKSRSARGIKFSINPDAIIQRILSDQALMPVHEINPIHDIKERTSFTYTGFGGRTAQSFVIEDRKFPKDGIGTIAESTVDSGKVGLSSSCPVDATLLNNRGITEQYDNPEDLEYIEPAQMLSVTSLLMPGALNDDCINLNLFQSLYLVIE